MLNIEQWLSSPINLSLNQQSAKPAFVCNIGKHYCIIPSKIFPIVAMCAMCFCCILIQIPYGNSPELIFNQVTAEDAGLYICRVNSSSSYEFSQWAQLDVCDSQRDSDGGLQTFYMVEMARKCK